MKVPRGLRRGHIVSVAEMFIGFTARGVSFEGEKARLLRKQNVRGVRTGEGEPPAVVRTSRGHVVLKVVRRVRDPEQGRLLIRGKELLRIAVRHLFGPEGEVPREVVVRLDTVWQSYVLSYESKKNDRMPSRKKQWPLVL